MIKRAMRKNILSWLLASPLIEIIFFSVLGVLCGSAVLQTGHPGFCCSYHCYFIGGISQKVSLLSKMNYLSKLIRKYIRVT